MLRKKLISKVLYLPCFLLLFSMSSGTQAAKFFHTNEDAARILNQATFGANHSSIVHLKKIGIDKWLEQQIKMAPCYHNSPRLNHFYLNGKRRGRKRTSYYAWARDAIFWQNALYCKSQLQQRVALALSEIMVISDLPGEGLEFDQMGVAHYYDTLIKHGLGNFRDLLEAVTLNPSMGRYLSLMGSKKADSKKNTRPDENYAREVMQLFTIGLEELNADGTPLLRGKQMVPTYTQKDVEALARILSGWTWTWVKKSDGSGKHQKSSLHPMRADRRQHDTDEKVFLGMKFPAGGSAEQEMKKALDMLFLHPNVGPFIGKQLIQKLVKSNPSPAYIKRISAVFDDNGRGVRGDLAAVVTAILTDPEARKRNINLSDQDGRIISPLLRLTQLWRAFNAKSTTKRIEGYKFRYEKIDKEIGQSPLSAPTVFNFFEPDHAPLALREKGIVAPETKLMDEELLPNNFSSLGGMIFVHNMDSKINPRAAKRSIRMDFTPYARNIRKNPQSAVRWINILLMGGRMHPDMQAILRDLAKKEMRNRKNSNEDIMAALIYTTVMSPQYNVQW